jgi:protein transport protein SEC24
MPLAPTSMLGPSLAPAAPTPMAVLDPSRQCPPGYMSFTLGAVPRDEGLLKRSGLPLGLTCHPIGEGPGTLGKGRIPVVNFGATGVVRCRKCRAYVNPFAQFTEGGKRWRCNFCANLNDVPASYFSPTDAHGIREDAALRPELSSGSVEFVAPVEYMVRPPQPPVYVFVLDVSYSAVSSGVLAAACEAIREALPNIAGGGTAERTLVGFITYDSTVHFYNIKENAEKKGGSGGEGGAATGGGSSGRSGGSGSILPSMLVVPEFEDLFVPLPDVSCWVVFFCFVFFSSPPQTPCFFFFIII